MKKKDLWLISLVISTIIILGMSFLGASIDNSNIRNTQASEVEETPQPDGQGDAEEIIEVEDTVPDTFTGLLIGMDASESLTDVLMVGYIDTVKNEIDVVSVPRDLVIDFRDELFQEIKANNPDNYVLYCKLNEVYNLTGQNEQSMADLVEIISIITGLEIDQVARIDVNGFSDLIDVIGGIEFNVPERMYYSDPVQDLYIDLQPGLQLLDGDKAEQLVRYRHYTMGDLQRIKVQQEFMVALFDKIKGIKDFSTVKKLATTGYNIFKADFGLVFALDYAQYFFNLDLNNILTAEHMVTIPSYGNKVDEIWFQTWDIDEAHQIVKDIVQQ